MDLFQNQYFICLSSCVCSIAKHACLKLFMESLTVARINEYMESSYKQLQARGPGLKRPAQRLGPSSVLLLLLRTFYIPKHHAARTQPPPDFVVCSLLRWLRFENCKTTRKVSRQTFVIRSFTEVCCQFSGVLLKCVFEGGDVVEVCCGGVCSWSVFLRGVCCWSVCWGVCVLEVCVVEVFMSLITSCVGNSTVTVPVSR